MSRSRGDENKSKKQRRFERRLAKRRERELIMTVGMIALEGLQEEERAKRRG